MSEEFDRDYDYFSAGVAIGADRRSRITLYDDMCRSADTIACDEEGVYRLAYDREVDETSSAVIAAVATVADTDPMELDPLYSSIDPEVIDDLFDRFTIDRGRSGIRVSFQFSGFEITATGHEITVTQRT